MLINLLYHDITAVGRESTSGFPGPGAARYKLTPDEFRIHLDHIASVARTPPVASAEAVRSVGGPAWAITFDDGGLSAITEIADQLEHRGWRGWFFIATNYLGQPAFCSPDQIRELHRRGHIIGSHSHTHPDRISQCSWDQMVDEWGQSCRVLSGIIGQPIETASVPGGFYSRDVARAASQAGIRVLFNSEPTTSAFAVDGILVLGRYNIYRGMSAADAVALMNSPLRRWRQAAFWNLKKIAKTFAGPVYKAVRHRILAREYANDE
ncbi:polysaccharide deacetylase family protein [Schlesneria paludicola]|uniref:polysaccharide deacetylase family protein n=1 Tax=Schlesneria paludicola TaxID=360056 RepID=UPI00029A1242|nr:polysaccharide deacetylase family protein [Schlesneria paludicola]